MTKVKISFSIADWRKIQAALCAASEEKLAFLIDNEIEHAVRLFELEHEDPWWAAGK